MDLEQKETNFKNDWDRKLEELIKNNSNLDCLKNYNKTGYAEPVKDCELQNDFNIQYLESKLEDLKFRLDVLKKQEKHKDITKLMLMQTPITFKSK